MKKVILGSIFKVMISASNAEPGKPVKHPLCSECLCILVPHGNHRTILQDKATGILIIGDAGYRVIERLSNLTIALYLVPEYRFATGSHCHHLGRESQ